MVKAGLKPPRPDVMEEARGRWPSILSRLGVPAKALTGKHGPCPMCGGKDRFRFTDWKQNGTFICNQCGSGSGIALLMALHGWDFRTAAVEVRNILPQSIKTAPGSSGQGAIDWLVRRTWDEARDLGGTMADDYLTARGLPGVRSAALRFHPAAMLSDVPMRSACPAMIAAVSGPDGDLATLHRTYLDGPLEWKDREGAATPAADRFDVVGYNSASRRGEPFRALIRRKRYLPNAVSRFCTAELKIDTMKQFMLAHGYEAWTNVVGLRADEMRRIAKQQKRNEEGKERWRSAWPMLRARVTKRDIWRFWLGENINPKALTHPLPQGFDLGLWPYEGNCDYCFLKGLDVLAYQERERPDSIDDWIAMEELGSELATNPNGARFVTEYQYATIKHDVARQPLLIPIDPMHLEAEGECGVGGTDTSIRCGR